MSILLCRDILFISMKPKAPTEKQVFFISGNLIFKQRPDLLSNQTGRLESTFIELIFQNKRNMICGCIYKHPSMKISRFNNEYLTPLLTNIQKEEKICMLMGDFNINLLNAEANINISHCVKSVRIRSYSGTHFPAFQLNTERYGVRMRENADQNNSYEYRISPYSVRMRENADQKNS